MSKTIVAPGIYFDDGARRYSYRPIHRRTGRRTEKRLKARTLAKAVIEFDRLQNAPAKEITFKDLAALYKAAKCPDARGVGRQEAFTKPEIKRVEHLIKYFAVMPAADIKIKSCLEYKNWRTENRKRKTTSGERSVDLELTTLSNIINYGVLIDEMDSNPIHSRRPRFHTGDKVRKCRERAPLSGSELHQLANFLFDCERGRSEVLAWQLLFEALTGCRTSEVLRFRMDAQSSNDAGFVQNQWLWIKRSKKGVNNYALIHPDLAECLNAHRAWHAAKYPKSPWFFPSASAEGATTVHPTSLTHALTDAAKALGLSHRTSHGLRSFYVTVRRSQGITDGAIAAEIGDKTGAAIISETYGSIPDNWRGGAELSFRPGEGEPAWRRWVPQNVIQLLAKV